MTFNTLVSDLTFSEGPRWHEGRLFYSDFYRYVVEAVDLEGNVELIAEVPNQPSGLGWLPDGRLLIVSMLDRKLLRQEVDGSLVEHADLSAYATWHCNDMVVDQTGRAYVGNFGFDIENSSAERQLAKLIKCEPDGRCAVAAADIKFPNGAVITPDQKTLILAETMGRKLLAFDIAADGSLLNRRDWATFATAFPDGICLDAEGAVWVADAAGNQVLRVLEGGDVTDALAVGTGAFACMLGGDNGKRLFVCAAEKSGSGAAKKRTGKIIWTDVEVERAGTR